MDPDILETPRRRNWLGDWLAPRAGEPGPPPAPGSLRALFPGWFLTVTVVAVAAGLDAGWWLAHHLR